MGGPKKLPKETWKVNDNYKRRMNYGNVVTRSQTCFTRVKNTESDMDFFANGVLHHPSNRPHFMVQMLGEYGALPRTIMTRSAATKLELDPVLLKVVKEYKKLAKTDPLIKEMKEYQKDHPNLLNPEAAVVEVPEGALSDTGDASTEQESSAEEKSSSGYESSAGETTENESSA